MTDSDSSLNIKTLESNQFGLWDAFVEQSPQGDVFCYSWWLEAITKSHFKILAIYEKGEIVAGIPMAFDAQNKINEPPVTRTLGVLYKSQEHLPEHKQISNQRRWLDSLLDHVPLDDFVQMCMHHNFTDWLPFRWRGFKQTTRYTYLIHYQNRTINDLWKNLNRGRKETINRAVKHGIRIEQTEDFELLYKFESLSYERQGLKFRLLYDDLKILDDAIREKGNRVIFKAIDNLNQVHAMLYVAFNARSGYALLSGSEAKLRKLGGHTLVMWEAVKFFSQKVEYFNFGGSDIERIEFHLRGFGGVFTPYFHIYNEKLIWKRTDIRYHFGESMFHLKEMWKILLRKLLKPMGL
jgi:hypothetical protein